MSVFLDLLHVKFRFNRLLLHKDLLSIRLLILLLHELRLLTGPLSDEHAFFVGVETVPLLHDYLVDLEHRHVGVLGYDLRLDLGHELVEDELGHLWRVNDRAGLAWIGCSALHVFLVLLDALAEGIGSAGIDGIRADLLVLVLKFNLLPPFLQMTVLLPLEREALLAEVMKVRSDAEGKIGKRLLKIQQPILHLSFIPYRYIWLSILAI